MFLMFPMIVSLFDRECIVHLHTIFIGEIRVVKVQTLGIISSLESV